RSEAARQLLEEIERLREQIRDLNEQKDPGARDRQRNRAREQRQKRDADAKKFEGKTQPKETKTPSAPTKTQPATTKVVGDSLTEQAIKKELELISEGRGRAVLGSIARVGNRAFAVLKVGGTLYVIYSLTQIHSLKDAGAFAATLAVGEAAASVAARIAGGGV